MFQSMVDYMHVYLGRLLVDYILALLGTKGTIYKWFCGVVICNLMQAVTSWPR